MKVNSKIYNLMKDIEKETNVMKNELNKKEKLWDELGKLAFIQDNINNDISNLKESANNIIKEMNLNISISDLLDINSLEEEVKDVILENNMFPQLQIGSARRVMFANHILNEYIKAPFSSLKLPIQNNDILTIANDEYSKKYNNDESSESLHLDENTKYTVTYKPDESFTFKYELFNGDKRTKEELDKKYGHIVKSFRLDIINKKLK